MKQIIDPEAFTWDGDFLLDNEYRFVSVARTINPGRIPDIGRVIWDVFGGENVFGTPYASVFETGEPVGFRAYFDGMVAETYAELSGRFLRVRYRVIATIDISTLDRLLESMRVATTALEQPFGAEPPKVRKRSIRARQRVRENPFFVVDGS